MYPPAQAARSSCSFDGAGFIFQGRRIVYTSGTIHYARVPHELWRDRLLRLRRANFVGVDTYAFWNFHESQEDKIDFTGDRDLEAFLSTAGQMGLYATVRVGPYVCAEWEMGGYPVWLKFKPNVTIRTDDPRYLALNDHWYETILPRIARHQIHRGGNVVLVQLENEHPMGWGMVTNLPYFVHLSREAVKSGIEVPYFMSGLHHGSAPMPPDLDPSQRVNPWYTTEFWAGSPGAYRTLSAERNRAIDMATWTILAHGGGGYNYYTLHGGTSFGSWSDDTTGASFDGGAAVGQGGDLHPLYYRVKRANQLAEGFPDILANGSDALADYSDFVRGPDVKVIGARRSAAGTLVFVQNLSTNCTKAVFSSGEALELSPFGTYPLPRDVALAKGLRIVDSTLPILAVAQHERATTLVVYGRAGASGRITLAANGSVKPDVASVAFTTELANPARLDLKVKIPVAGVEECVVDRPDRSVRVLAVNEDLSLYTWIIGPLDRQYVVLGPAFVQEVREEDGKLSVVLERPYGQPACGRVTVYGARGKSWHLGVKADMEIEKQPAPTLLNWQMCPSPQASPMFDDSRWKQSRFPLQMGADGNSGSFAWYRATVRLPVAGGGTLHLQGADDLEVFVNGRHCSGSKGIVTAEFAAGTNTVAVFASHRGRNKLYRYVGPLEHRDNKGLWGAAALDLDGRTIQITDWAMHGGTGADPARIEHWTALADTEHLPTFYRATFMAAPPGELGAHPILRVTYEGLARGMIWVNGHSLGRYPEKIPLDSLYVPESWLKAGENTLSVFDETGASPERVRLLVENEASREVIRATEPVDSSTPIVVPQERPAAIPGS